MEWLAQIAGVIVLGLTAFGSYWHGYGQGLTEGLAILHPPEPFPCESPSKCRVCKQRAKGKDENYG